MERTFSGRVSLAAALFVIGPVGVAEAGESPPPDELDEIRDALGVDARERDSEAGKSGPVGGGLTPSAQLNPALSIIADVAFAIFSEKDNHQRGGHDPTRTGFNLQQLELSAQAAVDPYFRFDANIVFGLFGVEIEEAYGTTLSLPWNLQLRAGQLLTRFGRLNNTHPHSWYFVDQPLANGKLFGGEGQRGLGVELSVLLPLDWYVEIAGTWREASGGATNRSFCGNDPADIDGPEDFLYVVTLKQFFPLSPNWSLAWGLSAAFGPNATGRDNRTEIYGTDLYLKWRPITYGSYAVVSLETEWMLRRRQIQGDVLQDFGGYAQVFWRFARRWALAARYDVVSGVSNDYLDPEEDTFEHRASASFTFWPTEFSRIRLQYSADMPLWRDEVVHAGFVALELVTGAHGAHSF